MSVSFVRFPDVILFRVFGVLAFGFFVSQFGSGKVVCEKGKTKLGSVVDQLYCPFWTTQGVAGGILLPLWFPFAPWVFVSPFFAPTRSLLASPRGFVLALAFTLLRVLSFLI